MFPLLICTSLSRKELLLSTLEDGVVSSSAAGIGGSSLREELWVVTQNGVYLFMCSLSSFT